MNRLTVCVTAMVTVFFTAMAGAGEVRPILKLDTGGHMARINKIVATKDGRSIVSASDDKTIRVWDVRTGRETRKILGQIGDGVEGMLFTIALSPDDRLLAVGGFLDQPNVGGSGRIRLYDFASGRLIAILKSHENAVTDLSFSPDGRYLVSGSGDMTVRVWEMNDIKATSAEPVHIFKEHTHIVTAVRIFPHGGDYRVVSAGNDNRVIIYSLNKREVVNTFSHGGEANSLAITQAGGGGYIASSGSDKKINIFDLDLHHIRTIDSVTQPIGLAFSPDGGVMLAGSSSVYVCNTYDTRQNFQKVTSFYRHSNIIKAVAFSDSDTAVTGGGNDKDIYLWDPRTGLEKGHIVGAGKAVWSVGLAGEAIAFGNVFATSANEQAELAKSFRLDTFTTSSLTGNYHRITTTWSDYSLKHTPGGGFESGILVISRDGAETARIVRNESDGFRHNTYGFTKDGIVISGGAHGWLSAYDTTGRKLADFIGHTGEVWGLAVDGDRLVSGSLDQTIRVWDLKELKRDRDMGAKGIKIYPVVSLFVARNDEWVVWTEEGFFNASKNGTYFIGYHINQGPEKEAEFVAVDRLYNRFYRPDLIEAKLGGKDISEYAKAINIQDLLDKGGLPPTVRLLTPSGKSDSRDMEIRAELCDAGGGIGDLTLFLNDMPVTLATSGRGLKVVGKAMGRQDCYTFIHTVTLQNGDNAISIMAYNKTNSIESARDAIRITHRSSLTVRPDLHILTIAIDTYRDGDLRLRYSLNDAKAIGELLKQKATALFQTIVVHTMTDGEVTKANLDAEFAMIGGRMSRDDVFLLFIAGHGITNEKDGSYYFLPVDFRYTGDEAIAAQGVSMNDFKRYLTRIPAMKSLLLLDTCNSGSFAEAIASRGILEKTAINKLTRAVGRATIAASSKNQAALEGYEGHGVFTYTVLQALQGKAADSQGKITINGVATYVEEELPRITHKKWGYEQVPQKTLQGMDFPIGLR